MILLFGVAVAVFDLLGDVFASRMLQVAWHMSLLVLWQDAVHFVGGR